MGLPLAASPRVLTGSSVSGNPANAAIPSGPYLVNTQATTSASNSTVSMYQNMLAVAPDDDLWVHLSADYQ